MGRACMAASGIRSLVFIDDRSSRMNCGVYRAIISAQIKTNAAKLIRQHLMVHMDNDPKHAKATQEILKAKKWDHFHWTGRPPDLN